MPAVYCRVYETAINLEAVAETLLPTEISLREISQYGKSAGGERARPGSHPADRRGGGRTNRSSEWSSFNKIPRPPFDRLRVPRRGVEGVPSEVEGWPWYFIQPRLVWLDSARSHRLTGRYSILGWDPWLTFSTIGRAVTVTTSVSTVETTDHPLVALRRLLARYRGPCHPGLPPVGVGWVGALSYSLNRWIERLPDPKPTDVTVPELLLVGMRMLLVVDRATDRSWCVSVVDPHQPPARALRDARTRWEAADALIHSTASRVLPPVSPVFASSDGRDGIAPTTSQAQFEAMVQQAKAFIHAGEIFQANLAQRFNASWSGSPWQLYLALRQVNPSPFASFMTSPELTLVSCSPERLVRLHDGVVQTRPIAGTRPRGENPKDDLVNSLELILSDKERAEHLMLVDLARNDVGRVCAWGSVCVDELMTLEDYSHVMHIVSNVQGRLRPELDAVDVIRAMFPGGTITGCPKIRSMEIIHELEPVGRSLYTGSCGWLGFDGSLDLNILIRTILIQRETLSFHVGAGIVADSDPTREYHETLAKAGALRHALQACLAKKPVVSARLRDAAHG
ncbi:MAG: anthranilate synthase component I family protein [Candidatus Omnitrophica bacterium]|nr:anthranilate synthase component I family protein [Candidatus Omnitrophota bacterium]